MPEYVPVYCLNGHAIRMWGSPLTAARGSGIVRLWGLPLKCDKCSADCRPQR